MKNRKKILIIDDDEASIEITRLALEDFYDIDAAFNSEEAMEKLKSGHFDLVVLDLMMEERDSGFTLSYAMKEDSALRDVPIIMLTSAPEKTGFHFNISTDKDWLKVDEFLEKPIQAKELLANVKKIIGA